MNYVLRLGGDIFSKEENGACVFNDVKNLIPSSDFDKNRKKKGMLLETLEPICCSSLVFDRTIGESKFSMRISSSCFL